MGMKKPVGELFFKSKLMIWNVIINQRIYSAGEATEDLTGF